MARVWNSRTLSYEEDGLPYTQPTSPPIVETLQPAPQVRPLTGAPVDTAPDPVAAGDLVTVDPNGPRRFPMRDEAPGDAAAERAAAERFPLRGNDPNAVGGENAPPTGPTAGSELIDKADALERNAETYRASLPEGAPAAGVSAAAPPSGMVETGRSTTTQTSQKVMTAEEKKANSRLDADAEMEAELQGQRSGEEAKLAKKDLATTKDANAKIAAAEAQTAANVDLQNKAIARLEDRVKTRREVLESRPLTSFFDPSRRTNAARFVAAISGAVGTFVAVAQGTRNFAQERIDKAVDQEFKEQEKEIAHNKDLLMLAKEDVQAAELKKKGMLYELQIKKVALLDAAERTRREDLAAHGLATADIDRDAKMLAIRKKRDTEVATLWQGLRKEVQSATTVQKMPAAALAAQAGANGDPMLVTDAQGRVLGRATTSPKAAEDARAALGGYAKFNQSANELKALIQRNGGTSWSGEDAGRMASLHGSLIGAARSALFPGGGTLDEGFVKLLEKMAEDPSGFSSKPRFRAQMIAKLEQSQKAVDQATKATLGAAGLQTGGKGK